MPRPKQIEVLRALRNSDGLRHDEKELLRKRDAKSKGAAVSIPACVNPERRAACLDNPQLFLKTYFPDRFYNPFARHHIEMIAAIERCMIEGEDEAQAAPRGDGKTEICLHMIIYGLLRRLVRFPVIVAATGEFAHNIFRDIKSQFENNELLLEDFPEICVPIKDLDGAPQRAAKQHVDGYRTRIEWTQDRVVFPTVPGSPYGGVAIAYKGLDAAIRGIKVRGQRPDFVLIDDPETRESAKSEHQIRERTIAIDRDIAGLAGPDKSLARVMLTTLQNRQSLSYVFTDPAQRPAWHGKRFAMVTKMPANMDRWNDYIALRQADQKNETTTATDYYVAHCEEMHAGSEVSNPHRYKPGELSALQSFFNRVADLGWPAVNAELQNDPDDDSIQDQANITPHTVRSRMSGLLRNELPKAEGLKIVCGIDVGKYYSHWCKVAIYGQATCHVIDYGVMETHGLTVGSDEQSVEQAILKSLETWRMEIQAENRPELVMVDSGDYTPAVYEFIRRAGSPFVASKGWEAGRMRFDSVNSNTRRVFQECVANYHSAERLWLYSVNSSFWKAEVHRRFMISTFNEAQIVNDGALSVWSTDDRKEHLSYSHHICAEANEERFIEGKGLVKKWVAKHRNNHWLDATALAICAGGCLGIRTISQVMPTQPQTPEYRAKEQKESKTPPNRFQQRPGGWLKGMKR
jgi:hypothetical protein